MCFQIKVMSKYLSIIIFILLLTMTVVFASAVIVDFKGETSRNKISLKWSTLSEVNCKEFRIERGLDQKIFQKIGTVPGAGNSSMKRDYEYDDRSVFRTAENTFYYRIIIIDTNGSESAFSEIVGVTASVSSVRHTWGSIKAMFR